MICNISFRKIVLTILLFSGFYLYGEERIVFLSRGPLSDKGITFIAPNADSFQYAVYEIDENKILVYAPDKDVSFKQNGWVKDSCSRYPLIVLEYEVYNVYFYMGEQIFILVPKELEYIRCTFIEAYIPLLKGFLKTRKTEAYPFPAVIIFQDQ